MHESLMTREEGQYAAETEDMFIVQSPLRGPGEPDADLRTNAEAREYSSEGQRMLSPDEIRTLIREFLAVKRD